MLMSADDDWVLLFKCFDRKRSFISCMTWTKKQLFIGFFFGWNKNCSKFPYLVQEKAYMRTA